MSNAVILYDRMILAINKCHDTDEVKDIRDKALALEVYARQAKNLDAERKAIEIRIRAERRAGELFAAIERFPGNRSHREPNSKNGKETPYTQARNKAKIGKCVADRWQKLASIPQTAFDKEFCNPLVKPSTHRILSHHFKHKHHHRWSFRQAIQRIERTLHQEMNLFNKYGENVEGYLRLGKWLEERGKQWSDVRSVEVTRSCNGKDFVINN